MKTVTLSSKYQLVIPREVRANLELGLAMADAIILATARRHHAEIVTGDADFDGLPSVTLIR